MGWALFWLAVVAVVVLMWFSPSLRRRSPRHDGRPGRTDGATDAVVREGERARGLWGGGTGFGGASS